MKIQLNRNELSAALLFASTDGSRYILNSVRVETTGKRPPKMISTDGRRMAIIETQEIQPEEQKEDAVTLSRDFVKLITGISKSVGGIKNKSIHIESSGEVVTAFFIGGESSIKCNKAAITARYPNWKEVVPPKSAENTVTEEIGFNPRYVSDFHQAGLLLGAKTNQLQMRFTSNLKPLLVRCVGAKHFLGIVMPCRLAIENYHPEFLDI